MSTENTKASEMVNDNLDDLLADANEGVVGGVSDTSDIDDLLGDGDIGDIDMGGANNVLGGEGDQNLGGGQDEKQGGDDEEAVNPDSKISIEEITELTAKAKTVLADQELRDLIEAKSEIAGYIMREDEKMEFYSRRTRKKDAQGNLVFLPNGKEKLEAAKKAGTPKPKDSEIYEFQVEVEVRHKSPTGFLGAILKAPGKALTKKLAGAEDIVAEDANAPLELFVLPKRTLGTVVNAATNGSVKESQAIRKAAMGRGKDAQLIPADSEKHALQVTSSISKVAIKDANGNPTNEFKSVPRSRVTPVARRSFAVPGNYIPLTKFNNIDVTSKLTPALIQQYNEDYLTRFTNKGRNSTPSVVDLLEDQKDQKGKRVVLTTNGEGVKTISSRFFTADQDVLLKDLITAVPHWFNTNADGKPVTNKLMLPKINTTMSASGTAIRKRETILLSKDGKDDEGKVSTNLYSFEDPKSFAEIKKAAGPLLTWESIEDFKVLLEKEEQEIRNDRVAPRKNLTFTAEETSALVASGVQFEGIQSREATLQAIQQFTK